MPSAKQQQDNMGNREYVVQLELTEDGTKAFADATTENVGNVIQIVYDDNVISAPRVNEAITGGTAMISGMASAEEAAEPCFFDPYRFPVPSAGGDPFQRGRSTSSVRMRSAPA